MPPTYTYIFHRPPRQRGGSRRAATVAQWQSTGFVNRGLWVQLPPVAWLNRSGAGQVAERPMVSDCKSDGLNLRGFESLPAQCGCSLMVKPQPSKLATWVRFPSPALAWAGQGAFASVQQRGVFL